MQHVEFVQGNDKRQVLLDLINTVEVRARTRSAGLPTCRGCSQSWRSLVVG